MSLSIKRLRRPRGPGGPAGPRGRVWKAAFFAAPLPLLAACAGLPPLKERLLAAQAIEMARQHRARELAPSRFLKGKRLYKEAMRLFEDRYYGLAKSRFQKSRQESEKAENISRLKKHRKGDFS